MPARLVALGIAVTLSVTSTSASADTMPTRKAGLWKANSLAEGNTTARQCIDEKTDQFSQGLFGAGSELLQARHRQDEHRLQGRD